MAQQSHTIRVAHYLFRDLLSGAKTLVAAGASADLLLVSARLDDAVAGPAVFIVDRRAAGVSCRSYRLLDGSRAADIELRDVELDASALLIGLDRALAVLEEATELATLASVAEILGVMEAVMAITADYIKARVQFGQPIGKFQALQHRMAEMFVAVQETRSILYCGIAHLDRPAEHLVEGGGRGDAATRARWQAAADPVRDTGDGTATDVRAVHVRLPGGGLPAVSRAPVTRDVRVRGQPDPD